MPDLHSKKLSLNGAKEILAFFREYKDPLFYISTSAFNVLGAEQWIASLSFINSLDSFDGHHPRIFTSVPPPGVNPPGITGACNYLLGQPSVADHVGRSGPGAGVLFLMFDEHTETLARALGLNIAHPPAKLRQHLDSKITTTRLATRAGISSVPNVLARVDSYRTLREVASGLGPDLVVQLPLGDSGATTFFISSESDYRPHASEIAASAEVKVMKRIRCRQTTIEGCVTRHGVLAGPLMTELVGFPELTPFPGGWCGNEIFSADASTLISPDVRRQAGRAVVAMGEQLREEGYWGSFGLDFLLDQDSGALYLGEMNPRITGASPLANLAAHDQHQPPLLLFHLLEWLGLDFSFDIDEYNQRRIDAAPAPNWSQLIIDNISDESKTMTTVPLSGIWQLQPDGGPCFSRQALNMQAITDESEALFMRTIDAGQTTVKGGCVGRLTLRGRLIDDDYRLTPRTARWIRGFRQIFDSAVKASGA
jgi:D-alanine-D-alanine ligase-like ATP-grasp enzyme